MGTERAALLKTPVVERAPVLAATLSRSAADAQPMSFPAVQNAPRVQMETTIQTSRSALVPAQIACAAPVSLQFERISHPSDASEVEARETARKVMRMEKNAAPEVGQRASKSDIQRSAVKATTTAAAAQIPAAGGAPLPSPVRSFMEPRFGADFGNVRIHTGEEAAKLSDNFNAHAFTYGEHIFFGRNNYQPETPAGRELIAHELTHTIQQGRAIQRSETAEVAKRSEPEVQRFGWPSIPGIGKVLDWFAGKANIIPGYRLFCVLIGFNPINGAAVPASAAEILKGLLELIFPIGTLISQALQSYGIMDKVGPWVEAQLKSLGMVGTSFKQAFNQFADGITAGDVLDFTSWGDLWERGWTIFSGPIVRLKNFGLSIANGIIDFVRDAVLMPLAKLAGGTRGYDLLRAVLKRDPVSGEVVERTPDLMIGGIMKFIGQEDVWENIKKGNALARTWAWFQQALAGLMALLQQVPPSVIGAIKAFSINDLLNLPGSIAKIVGIFLGAIGRFVDWGGKAVWNLLEIVIDVVNPEALGYIKRTGGAIKSIFKNPLPFAGNLVRAAKLGFQNFGNNFLTHLQNGLISWLTGALPGVYLPKALSLAEIGKFVLSVLGLTWTNIRGKLVKAVGETAVKTMETGFELVMVLVNGGPGALWEKIKEQLTSLKDMAIGAISDFVVDMVVKKAIPKLISMFIPGAGFISAIISIYDTILVIRDQIKRIAAVVGGFLDSMVAIAAGQIGAAAKRVEGVLANALSLAINVFAAFIGLGKVSDKVMAVLAKIRAPIDKALDWLIGKIVAGAKKLFAKAMGRDNETEEQKQKRLEKAAADALAAVNKYSGKAVGEIVLKPILAFIKIKHGLTSITPFVESGNWSIRLEINPITVIRTPVKAGDTIDIKFQHESKWPLDEFLAKAHAMEAATKGKKVETFSDPENFADKLPSSKQALAKHKGSTSGKRIGGQASFRAEVHEFIDKFLKSEKIADAKDLMKKLDADHQQELQVGGEDEGWNLALVEKSMNRSMGSQLKNALKDIDGNTIIKRVEVDAKKSKDDKGKVRKTGTARELQTYLEATKNHADLKELKTRNLTKAELEKGKLRIYFWFKLD